MPRAAQSEAARLRKLRVKSPTDDQERHMSLQRIGVWPNYPDTDLVARFNTPDGRGFGMRAIKYIRRGMPILSDWRFISVDSDNPTLNAEQEHDHRFLDLSCPFDENTPLQRFNANAFNLHNGEAAVFLRASRFNHSCVPNAHFAWNGKANRLTVHALCDIPNNAEIFVNYYREDFLKTTKDRRAALQQLYNFTCKCRACDSTTPWGKESQKRRKKMRVIDASIQLQLNANSQLSVHRHQLLADIRSFCTLLEKEELFYPQLANTYEKELDWWRQELAFAASSGRFDANSPWEETRIKTLEVARRKLDMDIEFTGCDSLDVTETLKIIDGLK